MDSDQYLLTEIQPLVYSFISEGPKGDIRKLVVYQSTNTVHEYNLALLDHTTEGFSDLTVSANNDMEKILATVIQTIDLFFSQYSYATLIFTGSDVRPTRLYRAVIAKYLDRVSRKFTIYGVRNDDYELFVRDESYNSFIIRLNHEN